MQAMYYLMDLERTLANGEPYFWKGNKHGYTNSILEAGLFSEEFAERLVKQDFDKTTVKINQVIVNKILHEVLRTYEGI
jgi:hypothetical protein